jgi:predicted permease
MSTVRVLVRRLRSSPSFALVSVITLAVGLGGNLAIFTVVNAVLLRPLPVPDSDRLVILEHSAPGLTQLPELPMSDALYFLYATESRTLDGVTLVNDRQVSFTGPENPQRIEAAYVTASFFDVMRTPPRLGRAFTVDDERPGAPPVVMLTDGLWRERFGGDPGIVGRVVEIEGASTEIVGVLPPVILFDEQLYRVLQLDPTQTQLGSFSSTGLARIADDYSIEQVQTELATMASNLEELFPDQDAAPILANAGFTPRIRPAREMIVGAIEATLWILLGAVGFLLLIACANVANLFLARAEARHRELAIRIALGESRANVIGTTIGEGVMLALVGGLVAAPLAFAAVRILVRFGPQGLPRLREIAPDANVLLFGLAMSLVAGLLFGVLPALKAGAIPASACLNEGGRGASATRERHLTRRVLVVVQIALALTLLVGSGLAARSFQRLASVDPGFDPTGVLSLRLSLPELRYESDESRLQFHRQLLERLTALPGATAVGAVSDLPLGGSLSGTGASLEGQPLEDDGFPPIFMTKNVSSGYFDAMGIEIVEGRGFERLDADRAAPVVIVSEGLARTHWANESALGKGIRQGGPPGDGEDWFRVVGVVQDVHQQSLHDPPPELAYYPLATPAGEGEIDVSLGMSYVVRAEGANVASAARAAVRALDPRLPISDVDTMETLVVRARAQGAFLMVLLLIASGFAVLLGAIGLYGVISYVVAQRRREIAIRMAIGAQIADIRRLVLVEAGWLALAGTALGLGSAVVLTGRLQALLFETSPLDPVVIAAVSTLLAGICLLASWLPARRAARVEPVTALRAE